MNLPLTERESVLVYCACYDRSKELLALADQTADEHLAKSADELRIVAERIRTENIIQTLSKPWINNEPLL